MKSCPQCGFELEPVSFGGWTFVAGKLQEAPGLAFTPGEAKLLITLLRAQGALVSRQDLVQATARKAAKPALVDVLACRVRAKLGGQGYMIGSQYGKGYCIKPKEKK